MRTPAVGLVCLLALAGCGGNATSSSSSARPSANGGNAQQRAALAQMNAYRAQEKIGGAAIDDVLDDSATHHAGYQALRGDGLTHYESTDGTPGGPPDSGNALFTGVGLRDRILAASGHGDIIASGFYYEDIASISGTAAIDDLWNTVYHRLPMMRHETALFGYGDQAIARATFPGTGVPAGNGYATCDFAAPGATRTLVIWPPAGQGGVGTTFDSDSESPDPLDPGNPYQNPHTPALGVIGTPIHLIAPTVEAWTLIDATVSPGGGSPMALFVLAGFPMPGPDGPFHGMLSGSDVPSPPSGATCCDGFLQPGEIFLLPAEQLARGTTYAVHIHATTAGATVDQDWSFTTAP